MKHLLALLLLAACAAAAQGQIIKSLGYNTTNGQVVYTGTNDLRLPSLIIIGTNQASISSGGQFLSLTDGNGGVSMQLGTTAITVYDEISFGGSGVAAASNAATTRTNLGLGGPWLTNPITYTTSLGAANIVVQTNTNVLGTTYPPVVEGFTTNALPAGRYIISHVSGTWTAGTNVTNLPAVAHYRFEDGEDRWLGPRIAVGGIDPVATIVDDVLGPTNALGSVEVVLTNSATLGIYLDDKYSYSTNSAFYNDNAGDTMVFSAVRVGDSLAYIKNDNSIVPAASLTNTADARASIQLGLPALTNTSNVTMMRALTGSTNTNEPFSGVIQVQDLGPFDDTIQITISNGIIVKVEL